MIETETDKKIARFWMKYIDLTKRYEINEESTRWYVKRIEDYIRENKNTKLVNHSGDMVENYLKGIGRKSWLKDWQFRQAVDALRILFVDLLKAGWAKEFPWEFWKESAMELPQDHGTIAKDLSPSRILKSGPGDSGLTKKVKELFPTQIEQLITEVRVRQYSIRTEQAYLGWVIRFIGFHDFFKSRKLAVRTY